MKCIIGTVPVGDGEPCFIIAEAGVNHNGDVELAKKLIDTAKKTGASAVKFQTFKTEKIVTPYAEKAEYQKKMTAKEESQYEMIKKLELTDNEFRKLANYAKKKDMIFLSSPFDKESVDLLDLMGVPAFKIPSGEITNIPFLEYVAGKGTPIILSTGMATLGEVEKAVQIIRQHVPDIILLHCVSNYPAPIEHANLRAIETLKCAFKVPVGFSDHTIGITAPIAAVALGACVIEKHFTLDKTLPGPDHTASLEPDEIAAMVQGIRDVEKALGNGIKKPTPQENEIKKVVRKSIVAAVDIPEGTRITYDMLAVKRPGIGIEPMYLDIIIGKTAAQTIKSGQLLKIEWLR